MDEQIVGTLGYLSAYSILIPLIIGLLRMKSYGHIQKFILALVILSFIFETLGLVIGRGWLRINNLYLLHIYTVGEFILLAYIFRNAIGSLFQARVFNVLVIVFISFVFASILYLDGLTMFNTYPRAIESIIVIFLSLSYFYKILIELKIENLERSPLFWFCSGLLIYFSGNLFVFILSNYIFSDTALLITAWGIHAMVNIVKNIFYAVALWFKPTNSC